MSSDFLAFEVAGDFARVAHGGGGCGEGVHGVLRRLFRVHMEPVRLEKADLDEGHCEKKVNGLVVVNAETTAFSWLRCAFYRLDHVRRAKRALDEMRRTRGRRLRDPVRKERPTHLNKIASTIEKAMEKRKESDDVQNEVDYIRFIYPRVPSTTRSI